MKLNNRGNLTLISLLAAAAIVLVLCVVYFGGNFSGTATVKSNNKLLDKSKKVTVVGKAIDTGKGVDCRTRLSQIRSGVAGYKAMSGTEGNPPTLKDAVQGVLPNYFVCPVSNQPYTYDPATGQVHCPYPPHAGF